MVHVAADPAVWVQTGPTTGARSGKETAVNLFKRLDEDFFAEDE